MCESVWECEYAGEYVSVYECARAYLPLCVAIGV